MRMESVEAAITSGTAMETTAMLGLLGEGGGGSGAAPDVPQQAWTGPQRKVDNG